MSPKIYKDWELVVPDGWKPLFKQFCKDIKKKAKKLNVKNFTLLDVKEKYGGLRVIPSPYLTDFNELVNKLEQDTYNTCYICGKHASYYTKGYILPICHECEIRNKDGDK